MFYVSDIIYKQIYICFLKAVLHEFGNELHHSHVVEMYPLQGLKSF
jgi:hypothetical protein